jgi:hypothetical protein
VSTIRYHRPDIHIPHNGASKLISLDMPNEIQKRFSYVPTTPKEFNGQFDPTGW